MRSPQRHQSTSMRREARCGSPSPTPRGSRSTTSAPRCKPTGRPEAPENYHVVDIALDDRDGATQVTLRQSNLRGGATDEDRANREHFEKNWKQMLDGLKETTER